MSATYRNSRGGTSRRGRSRQLRSEATDAERLLWSRLHNRQLANAKFRRQHEYGPYILDFFCAEHRLVIEVDGGQHYSDEGEARDEGRTRFLNFRGLRVLRFSNTDVLQEIDAVLDEILRAIPRNSPCG